MIKRITGLLVVGILLLSGYSIKLETPPIAQPVPTPIIIEPIAQAAPLPPIVYIPPPWLDNAPRRLTFEPYDWTDDYSGFITDLGDGLLFIPEFLIDQIMAFLELLFGPDQTWHRQGNVTSRLLTFEQKARRTHLFTHYTRNLLKSERSFFGRFRESYLNTFAFEDETEEIDQDDLMGEQRKLFWDALKDTYFSKYRFKSSRVRDEAFGITDWSGVDFIVIPPLATGYLYYRGLDKSYSVGDFEVSIYFEPIKDWVHQDELSLGAGLEIAYEDFPIHLIAAGGLIDNEAELEFIGIGTSLDTVIKMIGAQGE